MKRGIYLFVLSFLFLWFFQCAPESYAQTPTLSLKDSIPVAEAELNKAQIELTDYYLYSITYSHSSLGNYWYFTYRPTTPSQYKQIYVKVYMDKTTEIIGGVSSKVSY